MDPTSIADLVRFGRAFARGRCFTDWTDGLMAHYFGFHAEQGTLVYVCDPELPRTIEGLAVGWQLNAEEVFQVKESGVNMFRWQRTNPQGDSFFFGEVICRCPRALGALIAEYQWRFPAWRRLKTFTFRRDRLVQYRPEKLFRRMEGYAL